jgi:hypothetical protein
MYKLKTNQHDIPLSRLELLSSVPKRHATTPPRASSSPHHSGSEGGSVTPKPQQRQLLDAAPVSPSPADGGVVEMLTPLPGHMQMVGEEELTSSGVKGVAADGLLSLMGVRD